MGSWGKFSCPDETAMASLCGQDCPENHYCYRTIVMDYIEKTSQEKFPFPFCFGNEFKDGESLSAVTLLCVDAATGVDASAILIDSGSISGTDPHYDVVYKGGVDGTIYHVTAIGETNFANFFEKDLWVAVNDSPKESLSLQPRDEWVVSVDFANWLATADTIASRAVTAYDESGAVVTSTLIAGSQITGQKIYFGIKDCEDGKSYTIRIKITLATSGYVYERILSAYCRAI